jgi:hypothetical protein
MSQEVIMGDLIVRRWTGGFGVAAGILILVVFVIYLLIGTPTGVGDTAKFGDYITKNNGRFLTITLLDTLNVACFLIFVSGFRYLIRQSRPAYEWASMLVFGVGLVLGTLTLVFDALLGGAALDTVSKADSSAVRALTEGSFLLVGSVGLIMTALFLGSAGYAVLATGVLPRWAGWAGYAAAVLNLIAVPSIYGGTDFSGFYTANGYAPLILGTLSYVIWLLIAGISLLVVTPTAAR